MARTSNEERRKVKQELILESARRVFCQRGFLDVTMKHIIEECGISRGGIYLYFSSIDEIFITVVEQRNKSKFEDIRRSIDKNMDFFQLLDSYFEKQKHRLLHMEDSLLRAMYEYLFTHRDAAARAFRDSQTDSIRRTVGEILLLGVRQDVIEDQNISALADHLMFMIEGLSVFALLGGLTEEHADGQLALLKAMLPGKGGE